MEAFSAKQLPKQYEHKAFFNKKYVHLQVVFYRFPALNKRKCNMLYYYLLAVAFVLLLAYILLVRFFTKNYTLSQYNNEAKKLYLPVSIIIPARNEEKNLAVCLQSIAEQNYPQDLIEIIVLDDNSDDTTVQIVDIFIANNKKLTVKLLSSIDFEAFGKKNCLAAGIKNATHTIILQLDADSELSKESLALMMRYFTERELLLLFGPVRFRTDNTFFSEWVALEFQTLTSSGAACIDAGKPLMGNAAFMMYDKDCYLEYLRSKIGSRYSSGDDLFFMQYMESERKVDKIGALVDSRATVMTEAPGNLKEFFRQRIRWAGKTGGYITLFPKYVAMIVFFVSACFITMLISALFSLQNLIAALAFIGIKILFEGLFLHKIKRLNNQRIDNKSPLYVRNRASVMLALALLQPFYIVLTALFSFFYKPDWKGRSISSLF